MEVIKNQHLQSGYEKDLIIYFKLKTKKMGLFDFYTGNTTNNDGLNLIYSQTITFKESLCGFEYLLNFIDGSPLRLKSSRGNIIQNGDDKSVKGKGFTRDGQVGDLVIRFKVTPQELSEEQILLFEKEL